MSADIETGYVANVAAWWDVNKEFVHDGLMTKDEAWELGGINWEVDLVPIEYNNLETDYNLVVRDKDDKVLSCVGEQFTPLQNRRLMDYMTDLVEDSDLGFESALSLKGGEIVAVCARRPEGITIAGEEYLNYLTGANWHNGTRQACMYFSNVRTVCRNTLNAGLYSAPNVFKFRHTSNIEQRMQEARRILEVGFKYNDELERIGNEMVLKPMNEREFNQFLKAAVPDPKKGKDYDDKLPVAIRTREGIKKVYKDTDDLDNIRGSQWGALQALVAYNDHSINYRSPDTRFEAAMLTQQETTQRGLNYLLKA